MLLNQDIEFLLNKFSHEIRNPLTTLSSSLQLIESQHPEVKDFQYWPSLHYDIDYLNQLLNEFSNYTKSTNLNLESFSFRPFLERISLCFASSIAWSDVKYTSKIDPSINQITGDKTKLQEVFSNLLKNAFEAAQPNHSIYLLAEQKGEDIIVTITDSGCGISNEHLSNIFVPFITYKNAGTGLGLAISERIIKAHGGFISVESTPGIGTTFSVFLKAEQKCDQESKH